MTEHVDTAYRKVTGATKSDVIDAYRQDYRLSIEDFAEQVRKYIAGKPKGFRLNFFVDEVGQYVAGTPKLMTNLQTIAESLATRCNGQSWILVTAQEDMNMVVGEMNKKEANDFTKIQARFKERMKLTSQDVSEVIEKRLLAKDPTAVAPLEAIFQEQSNNFNTMFDFADGSQTYRNFRDSSHFVDCYPFVPYQFVLFQSSIRNLSEANAFEGKNSSVGERSMLGVFQDVARHLARFEVGQLATFDLMFEGLRQQCNPLWECDECDSCKNTRRSCGQRSGPFCFKRAGRELNLLSHVLRAGSRVCFQSPDEGMIRERPRGLLMRYRYATGRCRPVRIRT